MQFPCFNEKIISATACYRDDRDHMLKLSTLNLHNSKSVWASNLKIKTWIQNVRNNLYFEFQENCNSTSRKNYLKQFSAKFARKFARVRILLE